eukprot:TRINITY_DN9746_c0_g1_i2.p1 TRINITY_DN9746_c0_g1~~TRINITY_DN9746_c0_g1_i2.p1  ORF type:complete len:470 (-),score=67.04 TRINITY_DN9746_c0_g1_i2:166-1575(-)
MVDHLLHLLARLKMKKQFNEAQAAQASYQMLLAISYLHSHNIVHCDIKLENFLYDSTGDQANLKLIDFGFSKMWDHRHAIHSKRGTPSYTAPEVFIGDFTDKCDLWSLGVVVFILLGGHSPFPMRDEKVCRERILKGDITWREDRWCHLSANALDFVKRLLVTNPDKRMSADEALQHPWLAHMDLERRSEGGCSFVSSIGSPDELLDDLRRYSQSTHLQRAALSMMAHHLSSPCLEQIRQTFLSLYNDRTGTITLDNLRVTLAGRMDLTEEELHRLFDCVNIAHDGEIQFSEFIAAVLQTRLEMPDNLIFETFELFDVNRDGVITKSDLEQVLGSDIFEDVCIDTLIAECAGDWSRSGGGITYEQFLDHMRNGVVPEGVRPSRPQKRRSLSKICGNVMKEKLQRLRGIHSAHSLDTQALSTRSPSKASSLCSSDAEDGASSSPVSPPTIPSTQVKPHGWPFKVTRTTCV